MALNPGDTLSGGQYRIARQLGRGGFGFVYLAQDTLLGEDVALKELIPALVGDEAMLKRFLAEARATMRLRHKHIVGTHNVFSEDGNYYIVMEYMPGGSLEERLQEGGPLAVDAAVRVAAEVCEGLACAHEEGVVHCDLKPHNILFDARGQAKVADFGIAHVSGEMLTRSWMTPTGFGAGTLPYMSPEQTDGVRDDPRVDAYAMGAVLYRMLTGRLYLDFDQRETPAAQADNVYRIRNQQPMPPSAHNPRIPAWLDGVVLRALAKRPEDRFHTTMELRAALTEPPAQVVAAREEPPAPAAGEPVAPAVTPVRDRQPPARKERPAPAPSAPAREPEARKAWPTLPRAAQQPAIIQALRDRPVWLWAVGALVVIVVVWRLLAGGGTAPPEPSPTVVAEVRATARATSTVRATEVPATSTPEATDTPQWTATVAPRPTNTALPAVTESHVLSPTVTLAPTAAATHVVTPVLRSKDGMVMVYVPAGSFWMGSDEDDSRVNDDEKSRHEVYLDAYYIDKYEVTNAQYSECVEAGTCQAPMNCHSGQRTYGDASKADHPVVCLHWDGARTYCEWAGARLPTEAEWEKAARGTDGHKYPWGDGTPDCNRAQYDDCDGQTVLVGSKPAGASPYGALDMAGNVWEWVADWYDDDYYANSPASNPPGPDTGRHRVLRGGSWLSSWHFVRAASRFWHTPWDNRNPDIGFRCAADSPGE